MTDSFNSDLEKFNEEVNKRNEFLFLDRVAKTKSVIGKYGEDNFFIDPEDPDSFVLRYLADNALPGNRIPDGGRRYPIKGGGHGTCLELDGNGGLISFRPLAVVPPEWIEWLIKKASG